MRKNRYDREDDFRNPRDWDNEDDAYYFDARRHQEAYRSPPSRKRMAKQEQGGRPARRNEPPRTPRKKPKRNRLRTVLITLLIVLLLLVGAAAAALYLVPQKPDLTPPTTDVPSQEENADTDKPSRVGTDRKEDFYTFLIIGRDTVGGGNTDTMLLTAYDVKNQALNVMSLPRDTMINVPWDVKKLNSVYNQYKDPDEGIAALDKEVAELVGFVPDYQVVVEWDAVGALVDAVGGVSFDVPCKMYKETEDVIINLKKGVQQLDGKKAMQLVRYRDYPKGDLDRVKVQQDLIKAILEKCLSFQSVTRIGELAKVFTENVKVNLETREIVWFAKQAILGGLSPDAMYLCTMPWNFADAWSRQQHAELSYVVPKTEELVALINERFNPYIDPLQSNELDIMSVDKNGKISSSTGKLQDTKANKR